MKNPQSSLGSNGIYNPKCSLQDMKEFFLLIQHLKASLRAIFQLYVDQLKRIQ